MNKLKKMLLLPRLLRATCHINNAWYNIPRGKIHEAEILFNKGEELLRSTPFKGLPLIEFKIMKGYIKFQIDKHKESLDIFEDVFVDIEKDNELSESDKKYLKAYIFGIAEISEKYLMMETNNNFKLKNISPLKISEVPLDKVSKEWKHRFPSRDHPDWDKYGV